MSARASASIPAGPDIKPSQSMVLMKRGYGLARRRDSTMVLGAMIMAAKLPVRLRIVVAAAEEDSWKRVQAGGHHQSLAGITVEIGNTDAEGRLELAERARFRRRGIAGPCSSTWPR